MKKLKLRKEIKKYLFLGAIGLVVLIVGIIIIKTIIYHKSDTYKLLELGYNKSEVSLIVKNLSDTKVDQLLNEKYDANIYKLMKEKYYLNKNLDNYLAYLELNANSLLSDVIATVNVKADKAWYDEDTIKETDISKDELILINKFYKLNKDVTFDDLKSVSLTYSYSGNKLRKVALDKYIEMYNAAKNEGLSLIITGSYRSYEYQESLYNSNLSYGGKKYADKVGARPGHSDHQSGLSLDITKYGSLLKDFEATPEFTWLQANAYKYGFILRYPKDKNNLTGFDYEPWHYRYVGVDVATKIYNENITFDEYYAYYIEK
jgi:LAS superfamily LD-carboxypeptidase LdcB